MQDLALQIAAVHHVIVDQAQRTDAGGARYRAAGETKPPAPTSALGTVS